MPETTVHMILSAVEQLAPDDSGAFVVEVEDTSVGTVFVERNRVCWAAYAGLSKRLRDLLREHLAWAADAQAVREQAKSEAMRRALRQHTIESLIALPQDRGERVDWVAHRNQGYRPKFTFSPSELLCAVNAYLYATEAAAAQHALSMFEHTAHAATFVPGDYEGGLIAIHARNPQTTISELDELGSWADAAFGVTSGFSPQVMRRAVETAPGEVCVAWRTSRLHTHAAVLERGDVLDRLVDALQGDNIPAVVSRRATRPSLAVRDALGTVAGNP